jgi:hypothetical protein
MGRVTNRLLEVCTWRSWKAAFGVQSTAYAGLEVGPDAEEGGCDLRDRLGMQVRTVASRH